MIFLYLLIAAVIDYRTKRVYRIGSILFIMVTVVMFAAGFQGDITLTLEKITSIFLFSVFVIIQGAFSMMGWGDVWTYIGVFFWLGSWKYCCMTIELLAIYMLLANLLFFFFNVSGFDWKKGRMKEKTAFLPAMAGAALILQLVYKFG